MPESISDTGPILHLSEIDRLTALATVQPLVVPDRVEGELSARGIDQPSLSATGIAVRVVPVEAPLWERALAEARPYRIQPADAQIFVLAASNDFSSLVLTDDLALRRLLEGHGVIVAGSFGILVRAYSSRLLQRDELEAAVEALFHRSSLHLSRAFRIYIQDLLNKLP
ncbi:MAG TPA: hypothetical protein VHU81_06820 [Thermoanaerobaculia bacterium]|nr:hypothetical protein [Thermoanaerobaculia bacterium]